MTSLAEIEESIRKNDEEIDACLFVYIGMKWSEYIGNNHVGGETTLNIDKPQIPSGMVDAEWMLQMISDKEKALNDWKALKENRKKKLDEVEKAEGFLGQGFHTPPFGANFGFQGVPSLGNAKWESIKNSKVQLENEITQISQRELACQAEMWRYSNLKVIDGTRFQAELAVLLKRKLELRLSHKKSIALRMVELRGNAPTAH